MTKLLVILLLLILFAGNASAWYSNDWDHRLPVTIDNTGNVSLTNYRFDVQIPSGINETSIRVVDDTTDAVVPHWAENVSGGVCYGLWFNASVESEINTDFYIYYDNNVVASTSSYNDTFGEGIVLDMPLTTRYADGNTMIDRCSYANNGTNDGATVGADSSEFNGTNNYINGSITEPSNCVGTVSCWIYPHTEGEDSGGRISMLKPPSGWNVFFFNALGINQIKVGISDGSNSISRIGTNNDITLNAWNYVVYSYDGSAGGIGIKIYVNGVEVSYSLTTGTGVISATPEKFVIGANDIGTNYSFDGLIGDFFIYNIVLTQPQITSLYEQHNTTPSITLESAQDTSVTISLHSKSPETLFTNYTGLLSASYIVESDFSLNMSSLAFLIGMNYTLTSDYHSYLKVPANSIADDGIYRAHNRNVTPYLSWEDNDTITEGNVWKWSGGEYGDFWITNTSINSTHTWVNMTGVASNVFSSMFYLGRSAMYESEKTGIEINRAQGVIFKIWDLEQFRGRSHDYYLSLYFDTQIESTPNANIEIWYCNDSFNPLTDDPCDVCDYKDTWASDRWMDHESWQPHSNVSFSKPLQIHAGTATCPSSPSEVNYIYLKSNTVSSKSYILNATNSDPGICNLTFGQTETMWLRNEISGTNTPHAYTPSFFNTFVRNYLEFAHHMYIANDQGVWGHSDYTTHPIGISNVDPTFCKYNYFWWDNTTDYNMNGSYTEDFWINITYGFDPDNGASLTHMLSLYDEDYNFVTVVNSSLIGNQTDVDVYFSYTSLYNSDKYRFKIVSTDNEGSTSVSWSNLFSIPFESKYKNVVTVIRAFPATLQHTLTTLLSYIPLLIGGLIAGILIILVMSIFGKLKRW